ncbi:LacI family DNA-binding transcriptional regulator [Dictyobacter formicarum]|nr:LacI family DNA-binding transcriptional regulator [Dictyobacter formicarum]
MKRRITIADIAAEAGVSIPTVSKQAAAGPAFLVASIDKLVLPLAR